jgi:branched-chain amino acid transport system ATP-binding protein
MSAAHDDSRLSADGAALIVSNVRAGYGRAEVLHDVSLTVGARQVTALLGPNGAGKSTLLRVIGGLIHPSSGSVSIEGQDVTKRSPHWRARRGLCEIPERRGIFGSLSVRENLLLLSPRRAEPEGLTRALEMFPVLKSRMGQTAGSLSGGEQQMLAMSRAIIVRPRIVLFDEVSLGLAPIIVDRIYEAVSAIIAGGSAVLLVEQYIDRALGLADAAILLERGTIRFTGTPSEVRSVDLFETYLGSATASRPQRITEITEREPRHE